MMNDDDANDVHPYISKKAGFTRPETTSYTELGMGGWDSSCVEK